MPSRPLQPPSSATCSAIFSLSLSLSLFLCATNITKLASRFYTPPQPTPHPLFGISQLLRLSHTKKMKKSGLLAASVAAASATAVSVSSSTHNNSHQDGMAERGRESSSSEKFAPKFDGLRFIETLITAHR